MNDLAVQHRERILSEYSLSVGRRIYIITETLNLLRAPCRM